MKDKDPNEDEFNQDEQDNINEADDSFGLPDLDFNTLDEVSEEESEPEESSGEPEDQAEEPTEEPVAEGDSAAEDSNEEVINDPEADNIDEELENSDEDNYEENVRSSYVPPKPESNKPKLVIALLITLVVSVGIWYFAFYKPQADADEKARIEAENIKAANEKKAAAARKKEEQRLAKEKSDQEAVAVSADQEKEEATFSTISEPTGRYYIVVQSFIDSDMAEDLGKKMAGEGVSTVLLKPKGKKRFNRLTMNGDYGSYMEAQEAANKLKGEYGEGLWVVKY